jgi:hypothetical protein
MYYHYSTKPLSLSDLQDIDTPTTFSFIDFDGEKPGGVWLSDGIEWETKDHRINQMYKYKVTLKSNAKLLVIETVTDLQNVTKNYGFFKNRSTFLIKWNNNLKFRPSSEMFIEMYNKKQAMSDDYDGIVIKNYDKSKDDGAGWYRLIDINCACIWRPSKCIKEWTLEKSPEIKQQLSSNSQRSLNSQGFSKTKQSQKSERSERSEKSEKPKSRRTKTQKK